MSAADSDVLFDRARVRDRVTQRVNELWQTAITNTIRHGPPLADLRIPPKDVLRATRQLACALDHKIIEIRHTSGLLGEHLDEKTFTDSSATDPNCKMANVVITLWQKLVFEPQRDNIERLIAGLRMAKKHGRAQDQADELLDELKKSTILPSHREVRELVVKSIDLIQVTPLDNAPGGADHAPPKNTQRPGDPKPESVESTIDVAHSTDFRSVCGSVKNTNSLLHKPPA